MMYILSFILVLISITLYIYVEIMSKKNTQIFEKERAINPNILIIIPARNESAVIEDLLLSIQNQTVKINPKNVYVIVEEASDPTIEIARSYQMNYFIRKKLHLKTKGYAIDELIEYLSKENKFYDCYFIFDADNVLENTFIEYMLKDYQKGYTISTGYRALKNKENYFPVSAGLTFFLINELHNKKCLKRKANLILSGTGYYIHGRLIKNWQGFPFHSLTEDYESSLYYTVNGISTNYNEEAIFFDEQPKNYKQSITQRSRWIKGYFENWKKYRQELKKRKKEKPQNYGSVVEMEIGILPLIFLLLGIFCLIISTFLKKEHILLSLVSLVLIIYLCLVILTGMLIKKIKKKMPLEKKVILKVLLFHPIFLFSYLHAFLKSLKKNLEWDKIEHGNKK